MTHAPIATLSSRAQRWAIGLTEQKSITGTDGEAAFGPWLAAHLREQAAFQDAEVWTIEVKPQDGRHSVAMLLRGSGRSTVLLTGHYDTVGTSDYGQLEHLATRPDALTKALRDSLVLAKAPAAVLAHEDFAGGEFVAGRGLLDMKAGLAAGLAVCAEFAESAKPVGNLLFIAVPDEENNSAGARKAAQILPGLCEERDLDLLAVINLDAIADDGDGSKGRVIALGIVGKLLPAAWVVGVPTHSGFPLNGPNAGAIAAAIAARIEWAPELTDACGTAPGTPPSLLGIADGKTRYDVTTPGTAHATFNVLSYRRTPDEVLDRFDSLCAEAASNLLREFRHRVSAQHETGLLEMVQLIPVHRYETLLARIDQSERTRFEGVSASIAAGDQPLPEKCRLLTEQAWELSRLAGPAIVTGFGSIPYLPTNLSAQPAAVRLRAAAIDVANEAAARYGNVVTCADYFAGISDMSFFGEADESSLDIVARNTPAWKDAVRWPPKRALANIPTINIGPWGRDYHTPLERLHVGYSFTVLPRLIRDVCARLLQPDAS
ncbi:M20/M25/M40 family metallo-hydrolase [Mesorhizobium salmacidum]|uniref:M20/M25/M40 family metallo-hydrolase n=1 Tax=Mesorhizobium salmacidum TaxID=3015171 RepID=A0ABU8L1K5_9HYPH